MSRSPVVVVCALLVLTLAACGDGGGPSGSDGGPDPDARPVSEGRALFEQTCASCHGADLKGTTSGPPFLDPIYAPNHHPDEAFYAAVENGVQPHHWDFGPMPAQPGLSEQEVAAIVAYVRSEQAEAGITEDPSHP
ncbi:MAG: c-type cytochrome [Actinomycetota bacterium]